LRIAGIIHDSIVDGPGLRFAVFAQGCDLRCEGCHNPDVWESNGGKEIQVGEIIAQMRDNPLTDGLTLTGGEPFMQAADCVQLAAAAREDGLNVWVFSGHTYEELLDRASYEPELMELLKLADVLVDGRFIISKRTLLLKWRGSKNQRIIDVPKSLGSGTVVEWESASRGE